MQPTAGLLLPLNHLLQSAPWASERLHAHAGAHVAIHAGPFRLNLVITGQGLFSAAEDATATPDVLIQLPDDFAVRAVVDRSSLMSKARLSGSADIAETLAFVFRHLEWDSEADLARLVGDIAARRLHRGGLAVVDGVRRATQRMGDNLSEYLGEEDNGLVAGRAPLQAFLGDVDRLRDDIARLEKRLERLERH